MNNKKLMLVIIGVFALFIIIAGIVFAVTKLTGNKSAANKSFAAAVSSLKNGTAAATATVKPFPTPVMSNGQAVVPVTWDSVTTVTDAPADERARYGKLDLTDRIASPALDVRIRLYASNTAAKPQKYPWAVSLDKSTDSNEYALAATPLPASGITPNGVNFTRLIQPIDPGIVILPDFAVTPEYTDVPYACFIDRDGVKTRYFAYQLEMDNAAKVVWQVSKLPFNGLDANWRNPAGLVQSGESGADVNEFTIDFSKFNSSLIPLISRFRVNSGALVRTPDANDNEIRRQRRTYYVRAVPVDSAGTCIGDPGTGLEVIYGKPITDYKTAQTISPSFELWYTYRHGEPSSAGEFPNSFAHAAGVVQGFSAQSNSGPMWFQLRNFGAATYKVVIQVSTVDFKSDTAVWENPEGLIYSKSYTDIPIQVKSGYDNAVPIQFLDFAPSPDVIGTYKATYYVRAVALKQSQVPGSVEPSFSDTRTVEYSKPTPIKIYSYADIVVPANAPTATLLRYQPIHWEDYEWSHYFEVVHEPKWYEVNFILKNSKTGETLYPYIMMQMMGNGMSADQYEQMVKDRFLPVGASLKVVVKESEKSWWGDLWDSIVDFFSDFTSFLGKIVNWVASTYNNLKSGLINFVASNFPIYPESLRGPFKAALTAVVDYGLASMGIPPTLPNFQQLSEQGLDYAIKVSMEESGIPAGTLTDAAAAELRGQVESQMKESAMAPAPNPLNSPFLKNATWYQYSPAFVDIFLENETGVTTPDGYMSVTCEAEKWPWFPVYEPVYGLAVPALAPGEHTTVRVYLKEWVNKPYPGGGIWLQEDFSNMYWGKDGQKSTFDVNIDYNLPDAKAAAHALGLDANLSSDTIYSYKYDKASQDFTFTAIPSESYHP